MSNQKVTPEDVIKWHEKKGFDVHIDDVEFNGVDFCLYYVETLQEDKNFRQYYYPEIIAVEVNEKCLFPHEVFSDSETDTIIEIMKKQQESEYE